MVEVVHFPAFENVFDIPVSVFVLKSRTSASQPYRFIPHPLAPPLEYERRFAPLRKAIDKVAVLDRQVRGIDIERLRSTLTQTNC